MGEILLEFIGGIFEGLLEGALGDVLDKLLARRRKRREDASKRDGTM